MDSLRVSNSKRLSLSLSARVSGSQNLYLLIPAYCRFGIWVDGDKVGGLGEHEDPEGDAAGGPSAGRGRGQRAHLVPEGARQ